MLLPTRADFRAALTLAVPVALSQIGMMLMGTVDTLMVGRVSAAALAAVALGNLYFYTISLFGLGLLMVLDPVVSQAVGAGDDAAVADGVQRGMALSLVVAALGSGALLAAGPVLTLLRQPPDVVAIAERYCVVSIPGLFPFFGFTVLKQTLQAMSRTRETVVTIVVANVVNAGLNLVLIHGALGFPGMGAVGSAWSTLLARWLMFLLLLRLSWPRLRAFLRPVRRDALSVRRLVALAALGAPIGAQYALEAGAFNVIAIFMGWLGTAQLAGHEIALNIASFTFMVPLGVGAAAATLVGQAVGAGDVPRARRAASACLTCGVGFMAVTAVLLSVFPRALARAFTPDLEAAAIAATLIPLAGIFQVFDGTQVVSAGILRGIGDTRAPVVVNLVGFWTIGVPISLWLGFGRDQGAPGLWWGLVAGLSSVAVFLLARVRSRLGREIRRMRV